MEFSEISVQKRSNHLGGFRHETHKVTAIIPNALYTDVFQLMRAIVQAMNYEAVEFFKLYWRMRATIKDDAQFGMYGDGDNWFQRIGNYSLGIPEWKEEEQDINPYEAKALQEQFKWRWVVPREWDPNCVYSRFYYMTIVNGRVRLGRFRDQAKHRMRVSFSADIAQLLGFKLGGGGEREWHTFERDPLALNYSGDDIPYLYLWGSNVKITMKVSEAEYAASYHPNMDAITLQTLWIMCDGIEETLVDTKMHRPILRALPNNPYNQHHSLHMFGLPQFKRLLSSNGVDQLRIRMVENYDGVIVSIYGDVFIRIEVIPNDVTRV
jgi:hypothetical protein